MLLRSTKINLVISTVALVSSIAVLAGTGYWVAKDIQKLDETVVLIKESTSLSKNYSVLANLLDETTQERDEVRSYILHEDDIISFLTDLEAKGRGMSLELETTNLEVEEVKDQYDIFNVTLAISGTFNQTIGFIELLETLPYLSRVSSVAINQENVGGAVFDTEINLVVTLETYE